MADFVNLPSLFFDTVVVVVVVGSFVDIELVSGVIDSAIVDGFVVDEVVVVT